MNGDDSTGACTLTCSLTCPACGQIHMETMPTDRCVYFFECTGCGLLLRPKPGDCCVFCSYGTSKCPPMQVAPTSCRSR